MNIIHPLILALISGFLSPSLFSIFVSILERTSPPFSFFIYSFIPLLIQIWPHRFYLTSYNPLLSLLIFIHKLSHIYWVRGFQAGFCILLKHSCCSLRNSFLSCTRWCRFILCFLTLSWNQLFSQGLLFSFIGKWYLETKFCVRGVLTFITESFLLGPLRRQS